MRQALRQMMRAAAIVERRKANLLRRLRKRQEHMRQVQSIRWVR